MIFEPLTVILSTLPVPETTLADVIVTAGPNVAIT